MAGVDLRVEVFRSKASILHHELHVNEGVVAKFAHRFHLRIGNRTGKGIERTCPIECEAV